MDEKLTEEILSRVDALAAKLGTTAESLWGLLVADVVRRGLVMAASTILLSIVLMWVSRKLYRLALGDKGDSIAFGMGAAFAGLSALTAFVASIDFLSEVVSPHIVVWKMLVP